MRLASGALALSLLTLGEPGRRAGAKAGSWGSALALFAYAAAFSVAYLRIPTGVGALVLFGAVQATMIGAGMAGGERPTAREWLGLAAALGGLALLALPGAQRPDSTGVLVMAAAGAAWGIYTLRGRTGGPPLEATAANFRRTLPLAAAASLLTLPWAHSSMTGLGLAAASGALASGLGYALWYAAIPRLSTTRAAVVQLAVPAVAALAAIPLLGERPTPRLGISAVVVLGGVAVALVTRKEPHRR